jgi:hypothetical protein
VREFYRRSFNTKIDDYLKDYQAAGDGMRKSAAEMVGELLEYLHTKPQLSYVERIKTESPSSKDKKKPLQKVEIRERERRFFVVPELLASKGTINFRNVGDDYYAIVPPDTDLNRLEVRRAYLQYVIDPLVASNAKDISTFRAGIKTLLDERRKTNAEISPDVYLAVSRSLVAAVDARQSAYQRFQFATQNARQNKTKPISEQTDSQGRKIVKLTNELFLIDGRFVMPALDDEVALELSEAYERGAVLAFYFADQLKGFEGSGFDIASSLRDMILSLDTTKETNRLAQFADARNRASLAREELRKNAGSNEAIITSPVTQKLLDIDKIVKAKNYADAEAQLKKLLEQYPNEARAYYALGRVASLSAEGANETETRRHLLAAKSAYEKVISSALANKNAAKIDTELVSLSYIAVARIHEFYGETEVAIKIYEAAIKLGNTTDESYKQAVAAREKLMKEQ